MTINNINEILDEYIKDKADGFFVIYKNIKPNDTFKAIKECTLELWFIKNKNHKDKIKVITVNFPEKILTGHEDVINTKLAKQLLLEVFKFIENKEYLKL